MQALLRSVALALLVLGVASQASAGDKVWSVAGIINNGLATVFSCTNGTTAAATVNVEVFNKVGTADSSASGSVPVGATVSFVTGPVAALGAPDGILTIDIGSSTIRGGSARITAPSGVFCSAYVTTPFGDPPTTGWSLKVVKKTNQEGD